VRLAVRLDRQRTIEDMDAAYGIEQLEDFGWTAISSAKQTPVEGRLAVTSLLDVLARLSAHERDLPREPDTDVVYHDSVPALLMRTFESLITVCMEAGQPQTCGEILHELAALLERLTAHERRAVGALVLRTLPSVQRLPATRALRSALEEMAEALDRCARPAAPPAAPRAGTRDAAPGGRRPNDGPGACRPAPRPPARTRP
jgi:hypothetical protein